MCEEHTSTRTFKEIIFRDHRRSAACLFRGEAREKKLSSPHSTASWSSGLSRLILAPVILLYPLISLPTFEPKRRQHRRGTWHQVGKFRGGQYWTCDTCLQRKNVQQRRKQSILTKCETKLKFNIFYQRTGGRILKWDPGAKIRPNTGSGSETNALGWFKLISYCRLDESHQTMFYPSQHKSTRGRSDYWEQPATDWLRSSLRSSILF